MMSLDQIEPLADDALIQVVYASTLSLKGRFDSKIFDDIAHHAYRYNQQQGITGILCYGNGEFLQCIEGKKAQILALWQRIANDLRHKQVKVLLLEPITKGRFQDWRMRMVFLERWLWSDATKTQAQNLAPFLPFAPEGWSTSRTLQFLAVIKTFDNSPHVKAAGVTYNALGNMARYVAAPHQAFLLIQGVLLLLVLLALGSLFWWEIW
ncbi:BLUF domain-containing protein [Psychrobacter ciconiae]|uniref:BLUF domain-containing protein n=1 Tax=Psychrobacter ciconiae TaxID=1553449 RepID=UPI001919C3FD|nr:BLUF domain-containing protein [Psychrobacter ciconiae]